MSEASWRYVENLERIDLASQTHHFPLKNMYMYMGVVLYLYWYM